MTRLRWTTGERLTPIHAASCFALGTRSVDDSIARGIAAPMAELNSRLAAADIDFAVFWQRLVTAAAAGESDIEACSSSLIAAGCSSLSTDATGNAIASQIADIRLIYSERYPKLAEQLALRGRPIREQWDGYGAGLLKRIGKLTHPSFLPKSIAVQLISPYRGGDGGLDASAARIWIEAVLANPIPEIPEVLRVAWLVAQVGMIEAVSAGPEDSRGDPLVSPVRLPRVAALATLALTLEAASYLELITTPAETLSLIFVKAADAWRLHEDSESLDLLKHWWKQFQDLQTPPPVALKALDRMLHPQSVSNQGSRR